MSKIKGVYWVVFLSLLFLFSFYGKVIFHPNSYLFSDKGDGLKTYYVFNYHVANDTSFNYTNAVNYPYGEIQVFTDGQTFFANVFKAIHFLSPTIASYSIGFLNLLMLLSYSFCMVFLYKILQLFHVSNPIAIGASVIIGALSPQIYRLGGHISLAYCFLIPMVWYLQLKYLKNPNWKNSIPLICTMLVLPFLHSYYIVICGFLLFFNWLFTVVFTAKIAYLKQTFPHQLVQVFLPMLLFQLYVWAIDSHTQRSPEPLGLLDFTSDFLSVFLPHRGPFKSFFSDMIGAKEQSWEGLAFIGTSTLIIVFCSLIIAAILLFIPKKLVVFRLPFHLKTALFASILVLLYSFGYLYVWDKENALWFLNSLKQFRALGRFAWVFYFVITVYAAYAIHTFTNYLKIKNKKIVAYFVVLTLASVGIAEAFEYHENVCNEITKAPNQFCVSQLSNSYKECIQHINKNKYQAILPLPFFHFGSEAFTREAPDSILKSTLFLAYHLQLPMLSSTSPHCSMNEARKLMQLFSYSAINKEAYADFKNHKPFLVLYAKDALRNDEQRILAISKKIFANQHIELYELSFDTLFENTANNELEHFDSIKKSLVKQNGFLVSKKSNAIYFDDFENTKSDTTFAGTGAFKGKIKDFCLLLEHKKFKADFDVEYIASFWHYNKGSFENCVTAITEECNEIGQNNDWTNMYNIGQASNIAGNWSLIELKFKLKQNGNTVAIFTKGNDKIDKIAYNDCLLIRPSDVDVYQIVKSQNGATTALMKNNLLIKKKLATLKK